MRIAHSLKAVNFYYDRSRLQRDEKVCFELISAHRRPVASRLCQYKQEQNDKDKNNPNETISADPTIMKRGQAEYSSQSNANKRKAESKFKSSKPKKRTVELGISSDSDDNIDEKDIVQSDPEIDEDSDEETLMIK